MKNKKTNFIILSSALVLTACSSSPVITEVDKTDKEKQLETIDGFMSSLANYNQKKALDYTEDDEGSKVFTSEELSIISEDDLEDPELKKAIERHASAMKYKIKGEEYTDNEKVVYELNLTYSDAINYLLDAAGELMQTNALQGKNEEEVDKISNEVIIGKLNQEIKEKNSTGTITLEKKKDKWMITSIDEETRNAILMNSINVIEN